MYMEGGGENMNELKIDYKQILKVILSLGKYALIFIGGFLWLGIEIIGAIGEAMFFESFLDD